MIYGLEMLFVLLSLRSGTKKWISIRQVTKQEEYFKANIIDGLFLLTGRQPTIDDSSSEFLAPQASHSWQF